MSDVLTTDRLTLRRPAPKDWDAFAAFFTSERAVPLGGDRTIGRAFRAFTSELGHWEMFGYGMWAVTRTGEARALGLIGPWTPADWPEKEVGWMLFGTETEGTGIAREAARAAVDHAFEVLGWETVVSYIAPDNTRSIALAERLGAAHDPKAKGPSPETLVYRHPRQEDRA